MRNIEKLPQALRLHVEVPARKLIAELALHRLHVETAMWLSPAVKLAVEQYKKHHGQDAPIIFVPTWHTDHLDSLAATTFILEKFPEDF